jgi:hypothetical protein
VVYKFKKHYTRDEARALLPRLRKWLDQLSDAQSEFLLLEQKLSKMMNSGHDAGGNLVNHSTRVIARMRSLMAEFVSREILIKDIDRGLVDIPALIGGREVFLCWEKEEEDVEFWHDLETGFAGREPL